MSAHIQVNRTRLLYTDEAHRLEIPVEWSGVRKTEDHPVDFEIQIADMKQEWTDPQGEAIPDDKWGKILDEIAEYYSQSPQADIIGKKGALLRGVSKFRFYLNVYPHPSRYYEPGGYYLEIPMVQTDRATKPRLVLDATNVRQWTSPAEPITPAKLDSILVCALKENTQIGILR